MPPYSRPGDRFKVVPIEVHLLSRYGNLELAYCDQHKMRRSRGCTPAEIEALFPDLPVEASR